MERKSAGLRARRMTEADLEPLHRLLSDPEVMRYLEPPFSREQTRAFLERAGLTPEPLILAVDDGGFAAFYQAQFGDCMTQQCLEKLLANRLPTRIASLSGQPAGLTLQKRSGADHCYDFSADLQAADGTTTASVTGTITMVKEDGAWKASDLTLNLK